MNLKNESRESGLMYIKAWFFTENPKGGVWLYALVILFFPHCLNWNKHFKSKVIEVGGC